MKQMSIPATLRGSSEWRHQLVWARFRAQQFNTCDLPRVAVYYNVCVIVSLTYHCNIPSGVVVILFTVTCIQFLEK